MTIEIFNSEKDNGLCPISSIIDSVVDNKLCSVRGLFSARETEKISGINVPLVHQMIYGNEVKEIAKIPVSLVNKENLVLTIFSDGTRSIDIYDTKTGKIKESPLDFLPVYKSTWGYLVFNNSNGYMLDFYFPKRTKNWQSQHYVVTKCVKHCEFHISPTSESNIWNFSMWRSEDSTVFTPILYGIVQGNYGQYESILMYN